MQRNVAFTCFVAHKQQQLRARGPPLTREKVVAAQLQEPEFAPVHLVRRETFDKIAADCSKRTGKPKGLIAFVNATMAASKKG
jgi:hypothetical protein